MRDGFHPTSNIHPGSRIGKNVRIGAYAVIEENVSVGDNTVIYDRVHIGKDTVLGRDNVIYMGVVIGTDPQQKGKPSEGGCVRIGDGNVFREYATVHKSSVPNGATVIGNNNFCMAFSHVAHDCRIHNGVTIVNMVLMGGHVEVQDFAFLSGGCQIHQFCRIGRYAMIGGHASITKDVPPYMLVDNNQDLIGSINIVGLRRAGFAEPVRRDIKNAYRLLYLSGLNLQNALQGIARQCHSKEIDSLVEFIQSSKRGILPHREKKSGIRKVRAGV